MATLSKKDEDAIASLGQAWQDAKARGDQAAMDAAHAAAEQIRAGYGYSGGADGSQYIQLAGNGGGNSGGGTPTYSGGGAAATPSTPKVSVDQTVMSGSDYAKLQQYSQQWRDAQAAGNQAAMTAAHDLAEQLRATYGYSGGADGSEYIKLPDDPNKQLLAELQQMLMDIQNQPSYSYQPSEWDILKGKMAQAYIDGSYDEWTKGDQYAALAERWGQQGDLSMRDVLGQVMSRTGGLASSYAETVAQQQYNDYMAMLEDAARKQYSADRSDLYDKIGVADSMSRTEYERYIDSLNQGNTDRSYALSLISEMLGLNQYNDETAYNRGQTERSEAQNRIYDFLVNQGGSVGDLDADLITKSGYTTAELNAMQAQAVAKAAARTYRGGGSGGGSGTGSGTGADDEDAGMDYDGLFAAARDSGNPQSWLSQKGNYSKYGFTSSSGLYADYQNWIKNPQNKAGASAGGAGGTQTADPTVTNRHGDSWVTVVGLGGRYTWQELYNMVESGQVKEIYDPENNTVKYTAR